MTATDKEIEYWLKGRHDEVRFECVEITHPSFSRHYRFVRNNVHGIRAKTDDGVWRDFDYLPLTIKPSKASNSLEQSFTVGIGDVGEVMPNEIDRLRNGQYPTVKPTFNHYVFYSTDLSEPAQSITGLNIIDNNPKKQGAVFRCQAQELNKNSTGIIYDYERFSTLRGF